MITRLQLLNFRNHADTDFTLRPFTLLVGHAGSGKSNIFRGLVFLQNSIHRTLVELFPPGLGDFHLVRSRWADETAPIGIEVDLEGLEEFPNQKVRYTLKIADSPAGLYVLEETLQRQVSDQPSEWVFERRGMRPRPMGAFGMGEPYDPTILYKVWHQGPALDQAAPGVRFAKAVARTLSRVGYYHLEASELKQLGTGQESERMDYYGGRLPDFIAWTKSSPEGRSIYDAILNDLRELLPDLKEIIVTQGNTDRQGIAFSFQGHRGYIAAPELSDGTMFTLGLLCVLHAPRKPALLCIEEPETGLHPGRLRWLFDRFMGIAYPGQGQSAVQVILSTHSPYLVDFFRDMQDAVQIVERREGRTRITPLPDIQARLHNEGNGAAIGHQWATGLFEGL